MHVCTNTAATGTLVEPVMTLAAMHLGDLTATLQPGFLLNLTLMLRIGHLGAATTGKFMPIRHRMIPYPVTA